MSSAEERIVSTLIESMQQQNNKTESYDTPATVRRIEGDTAWVHIPGGIDETPVKLTINAAAGDTVQVRVSGGRAFLVGNASAPPTDDKVANKAAAEASEAAEAADVAVKTAVAAAKIAGDTNQYFWHVQEGTDTGAHITEIPQEEFLADPANGGGNLLARSNGIALRDGLTELATFGEDVRIGKESDAHITISDVSLEVIDKYGNPLFSVNAESDASSSISSITFHGDGTRTIFSPSDVIAIITSVKVNESAKTEGTDYTRVNNSIVFNTAPANGATVEIKYKTPTNQSNINYTFGTRNESAARGLYSVAEGTLVEASGKNSHAEGDNTIASGEASHAEGYGRAIGIYSHGEGFSYAVGSASHAEGGSYGNVNNPNHAYGDSSHAEGYLTNSYGAMAHAEGYDTSAGGVASHAQNYGTIANRRSQTVVGEYNIQDTTGANASSRGEYAVIVGNGADALNRSNALTVDWNGNVEAAGEIIDGHGNKLSDAFGGLIDLIYPVGSYYETTDTTFDPNAAWGGTWSLEAEGQVHVSAGANYTAGDTGGSENETLTESKLPLITGQAKLASNIARNTTGASTLLESASGHFSRVSQTGQNILKATNTSVSQNQTLYTSVKYEFGQSSPTPVSHMQPYVVVNRWHRTA